MFFYTLIDITKYEEARPPIYSGPRMGDSVRLVLEAMLHAMLQNGGLQEEGIFRISAGMYTRNAVKKELEKHNYDAYTKPECKDPHVWAGLLKEWVRNMLEPLTTASPRGSERKRAEESEVGGNQYESINNILLGLPDINRAVVDRLIQSIKQTGRRGEGGRK
jgi:hypothetical protein